MSGIKMTYSWGDEEELVECTKDNAWEEMLKLVSEEIRVVTDENEENCTAKFHRDTCEIDLCYIYDDTHCYYRFVEDYKESGAHKGCYHEGGLLYN